MGEFTQIEFDCGEGESHFSNCDLEVYCPMCGTLYRRFVPLYWILLSVIFIGIFYSQILSDFSIQSLPKAPSLLFGMFFIIILFFLGSVLRHRSRERMISFGVYVPVTLIILSIYGINDYILPYHDTITAISVVFIFIVFLGTLKRNYEDTVLVHDTISSIVVFILITNIILIFLPVLLVIFRNVIYPEYLNKILEYTALLSTVRIISAYIIALLVVIYAAIKALKAPIKKDLSKKGYQINHIEGQFFLIRSVKVMGNAMSQIGIGMSQGFLVIAKRVEVFIKELFYFLSSILHIIGLLLIRMLRFVLMLLISVGLAFALRELVLLISLVWESSSFYGISSQGWLNLIGYLLLVSVLSFSLIAVSYRNWNNPQKEKSDISIFNSQHPLYFALNNIANSMILYIVYRGINIMLTWAIITIIELIKRYVYGVYPTRGLGVSFIVGALLLIIIYVYGNIFTNKKPSHS